MKKVPTLAFVLCCLIPGLYRTTLGQKETLPTPVSVPGESVLREQDGLKGPVRRVRAETAQVFLKDGKVVEGPRVLHSITTYDPEGRKIDSVDYPIEGNTLPGKSEDRRDDKGNIVESVVRDNNGSILSKESYDYEFDWLGNWTKMSSSIAIYENGRLSYEPLEVTYRTITYYYGQAIDKVASAAKPGESLSSNSSSDSAEGVRVANATPVGAVRAEPVSEKVSVRHVAEQELREAAIELPQPMYPSLAAAARMGGKVEVLILVDERGKVINAQANSSNALLSRAAEDAARRARFLPARLSTVSERVVGSISYNFEPPAAEANANAASISANNESKIEKSSTSRAAIKPSEGANLTAGGNSFGAVYQRGVQHLASNRYSEAAAAFKEAVNLNPNDANAYANLAMSYTGLNKHKEAIAAYKLAVQIKRSSLDARAYYMWGQSYLTLEKPSEALKAFQQALYATRAEAIDPDRKKSQSFLSLELIHHAIAIAYVNSKNFGNAIDELNEVIKLNPRNADAYYALAIAYLGNGNRRGAENQIKPLSLLDPDLAQKVTDTVYGQRTVPFCRTIACRR